MTNGAFGIGISRLLRQVNVRVVAGGAGKAGVVGVVTATPGKPVGLKSNIHSATQIRHHPQGVSAAMACAAEFLR